MIGGADPTVLKSLEKQTPSVAKTAPPTVSAVTGSATSSGSSVARGIAPKVTDETTTYNQATQTVSGTSLTITSSTSNDPADIVTVYDTNKAISVSAVNQTVNSYKVNNYAGNEYSNNDVANYLPTFTGNVGAGNVNVTGGVYTYNLSSTGLSSLTTLTVSATSNLGGVGNVRITGGSNGQVLTTNGSGNLSWTTGSGGGGNTGNVTFNDINIIGTGNLKLQPDSANASAYLDIFLTTGPDIHIAGNGETVILGTDNFANVAVNVDGNVSIQAGDANGTHTWNFDTTGNLILAGGNSVIQSIANSSSEPLYPNVSTMVFTPDALLSSQSLVLDPTGPSHIHLRAPGANIDEPDANIFLGGEASSFEVGYYNGNVPNLYIHSGGNTWTFGTDGSLTLPEGTTISDATDIITVTLDQFTDGGYPGTQVFNKVSDTRYELSPTGPYMALVSGIWYLRISVSTYYDSTDLITWGAVAGSLPAPVGTLTPLTTMSLGVGGNVWNFSEDGNLTLPGNTFAVNYANGTQVSIPTVGNIATINLDGSNSNVLYGNGTFAAVSTSFDLEMHVSKDGNDSTGTGTILRPYLTITHALTQVTGGRNTVVVHPGGYIENPTITSQATQLITYDATGASTLIYGTVTIANTIGRIAGLKMTNLAITGNAQAYINSSTVDGQFTKSSSGYVEVDDCELQTTGNVLISGSGITTIVGNKIANLVVNNAGASVLVKGANDCLMPQVTAGTLNIVDSVIRASSNTANAVTASAGTVVTLMNNQIVTPAADNVARVSIAGYHSIISLVYDKANSTLSNSLNSVVYFQTANVDSLVSSGNITGNYILGNGSQLTGITVSAGNSIVNGNSNVRVATANGNVTVTSSGTNTWTFDTTGNLIVPGTSGGLIKTVSNASIGVAAIDNGTNNPAQLMSFNVTANAATSIISAYASNATIQTNATGTLKTWSFDNAGNLTAPGNIIGIFANGNSSISIPSANGNINISAGGTPNEIVITSTGANINGNLDVANGNITGNTGGFAIGYLNIPQVAASNATLGLTDAGKHYYSTTAGNITLTVPLNSSVGFATGTAISIVVQAAGNVLVNAASGVTLYMGGNATSGNRVVSTYGMATLMKVATNTWFINGTGVA
jgi:hypothetical protein